MLNELAAASESKHPFVGKNLGKDPGLCGTAVLVCAEVSEIDSLRSKYPSKRSHH